MKIPPTTTLLRFSAVLTLVALALMCWGVLQPTVWPVIVSMSVGQAVGTLAFVIYLFVIVRERKQP